MTQLNYISDETEVKDIRNIVRAIARKTRETPRQTVKDIEILAGCLERIVDIDGGEGNAHSILDVLINRATLVHDSHMDYLGDGGRECLMESPEYLRDQMKRQEEKI